MTPRDLIHDLFGHEDTRDIQHSVATIEKIHRHCSIFQVTFSSFVSIQKNLLFPRDFNHSFYSVSLQSFHPGISVLLSSLRAPPSIYA
jgi:hypothetical protein